MKRGRRGFGIYAIFMVSLLTGCTGNNEADQMNVQEQESMILNLKQKTEQKEDRIETETLQIQDDVEFFLEVSEYIPGWEQLPDVLNMEFGESWQQIGEAYEKDGFYMECTDNIFSMKNESRLDITLYGICLGDKLEEAFEKLRQRSHVWVSRGENEASMQFLIDGQSLYVNMYLDDNQGITSWYFCNWSEGEDVSLLRQVLQMENEIIGVGNEIEDWKQALIRHVVSTWMEDWEYGLIYLDDDAIPELYLLGKFTAQGDMIGVYHDGVVEAVYTYIYGLHYLERQNLFVDRGGHMDVFYDIVYKIEDGKLVQVHRGDYWVMGDLEIQLNEDGTRIYEYRWDGQDVSEEEYEKCFGNAFDMEHSIWAYEETNDAVNVILSILEL